MGRSVRWRAVVIAVGGALLLAGCTAMTGQGEMQGVALPTDPAAAGAAASSSAAPLAARQVAVANARWLSGAAGPKAANGTFGTWRHAAVTMGATWENSDDAQLTMASICPGGEWARWAKPLDLAVGAIDESRGESWAAAAKGAYDARWRRSLQRIKQCWGKRRQLDLYLRFAHEMNLGSMKWAVARGEEASFVAAMKRFSDLRYQILPGVNVVFCPSDGTDGKLGIDVRNLWPGKDAKGRLVANVYSVDTYNGYLVVKNVTEFTAKANRLDARGGLFGIETHRAFAESVGVPFAVSEWSNNGDPRDAGHGGEAPDYVRLMNTYFREHAGDPERPKPGQLVYEIQFNLLNQFMFLPTKLQPKTAAAYRGLVWGR